MIVAAIVVVIVLTHMMVMKMNRRRKHARPWASCGVLLQRTCQLPALIVAFHGLQETWLRDMAKARTDRQETRLIHHIAKLRTGVAPRNGRQPLKVHIGGQPGMSCMYLQDTLSSPCVGEPHRDMTIKPPGPHKGSVKHLRSVRGSYD